MNRAELRQRLRDLIRYDLEGSAATDAELNDLLNEAYIQTCWDCRMPVVTKTVSVTSYTERVPVPVQRVYEAHWRRSSGEIHKLVPYAGALGELATQVGQPVAYIHEGYSVRLIPIPAEDGTLMVSGVDASVLGNDTDTPALPANLQPAIVFYAASRWAERYAHPKSTYFLQRYRETVRTGEHIRQQLHAYQGVLR
jgi:hypothetical protein